MVKSIKIRFDQKLIRGWKDRCPNSKGKGHVKYAHARDNASQSRVLI